MILLLILTSFTACEKEDFDYRNDFEKSYKVWTDFKQAAHDSYRYTVTTSSWTGTRTTTVLTIDEGKVVKRSYVASSTISSSNELIIHEQWEEAGATLNTHSNGSALLTLDQVYQKAKTEWLPKRAKATSYFETKNEGMISSCGYVEDNCADDCFVGITIANVEKL